MTNSKKKRNKIPQPPPYATPVEIIRVIANALDIKLSNKTLDEKAFVVDVDYHELVKLADDSIKKPIGKYICKNTSQIVFSSVMELMKNYLITVASHDMDGIPRSDNLPLLLEFRFQDDVANLLTSLYESVGGPEPVNLVASKRRAVDVALEWIAEHEDGWSQFMRGYAKNDRRQALVSAWRSGDNLPSIYSIQSLEKEVAGSEIIDWPRVKTLLIIARAIDWARKQKWGDLIIDATRLTLLSIVNDDYRSDKIQRVLDDRRDRSREVLSLMDEILNGLILDLPKGNDTKQMLKQQIDDAREIFDRIDEGGNDIYWLDWYEARWYVLAGDLDSACALYEQAFKGCLYRAGENQEKIINEALVVIASQDSPDMVLLRWLKKMSVTFGYDLPSKNGRSSSRSNKAFDFIEEWEVTLWKDHFISTFPKEGWFAGAQYTIDPPDIGFGTVIDPEVIKPDYRCPNRKIKVTGKQQSQLIYFTMEGQADIVRKLLKKGAKVDLVSGNGSTAILIALQNLSVAESFPPRSLDDTLFNLLAEYKHSPDTLNRCTPKKRLLPLILAVESCRPEVVKRLLDMGADPNRRGDVDDKTALDACLNYIAMIKRTEKFWKDLNEYPMTPEMLDSVRRHTHGRLGHTLGQQERTINDVENNPEHQKMIQMIQSEMSNQVCNNMSIEALRDIAKVLLKNGANPNTERRDKLPGHTSMMLAAELDERAIFELMLIKNGDPSKSYLEPIAGRKIDCWEIATYFESKNVLDVLEDIQHHFRT